MRRDDNFTKTYYNNLLIYIVVFFMFFNTLCGVLVCISYANTGQLWIPLLIFGSLLVLLSIILYILLHIRIIQDSKKIIIYGKRFEKLGLKNSFKEGYIIQYNNIASVDLIPIKYFNLVLSYQICIKTKDPIEVIYINSFSNLDMLFVNVRAFRFMKEKKNA